MLSALAPGTVLQDRFAVDKQIAEGGMSRVYLGHPLQGAALVVIKELRESASDAESADDLRQFSNEFRVLQMLDHPSTPKAIAFFEENGRHYIVEEFAHGDTLEALLEAQGRFSASETVEYALSILDVLAYLHQRGLVYRDLKPSNVMRGRDGLLRLIDFGAVRFWTPGKKRDTVALGTPGFAAPEQYGRAQTSERSDIYSLGALLHFMLTGEDPQARAPWTFAAPHTTHPDVPQSLSEIVMRALSMSRRQRFGNAAAMRDALAGLGLSRPPAKPPARRLEKRLRRICYPHLRDYYRIVETVGISLFGVVFFAVSVPFWFASVPLPFPFVGMWLTAYALVRPRHNWKRLRSLSVEIYEEGLRIESDSGRRELLFDDVVKLKLTTPSVISTHTAEILSRHERALFEGVWPGFQEVVRETIQRAGLTEQTRGMPWTHVVEMNEKIYEKASS